MVEVPGSPDFDFCVQQQIPADAIVTLILEEYSEISDAGGIPGRSKLGRLP